MSDLGRGAGCTIGVDRWDIVPADPLAPKPVKFEGKVIGWDLSESVNTENDAGRGDGLIPPVIPEDATGGLIVSLQIPRQAWAMPPKFQGEIITVQLMNDLRQETDDLPSAYGTFQMLVSTYKVKLVNEKDQTIWAATLAGTLLTQPVWTGFGYGADGVQVDQPANADQVYAPKQLWAGAEKTSDPNGLQSGAKQRIRLFGTDDTDPAETQSLVETIGALIAPMTGLKLRVGTIVRRSSKVTVIDATWGLTDTKDDVQNPETNTRKDPVGLFDSAQICLVQNSPTFSAPTAPVGHLTGQYVIKLNDGKWKAVYIYGSLDEKQKIELLESSIDDDATNLGDTDVITIQTDSQTAPATPTPRIADLQLVRVASTRVGGTPVVWKHRFQFARNTPVNQIEVDGTRTATNTDDIGDSATIAKVTASATPPSPAPDAPIGQLIEVETNPLTVPSGGYSGFWRHEFRYGPTTKLQAIEFEGDASNDPSDLNDEETVIGVSSSAIPPALSQSNSDLQFYRLVSSRFQGTPEKWKHTATYRRNTARDDLELEATGNRVDPDNFGESATIAMLNTSATPPTPPTAPTGQWIRTDIQPLKAIHNSFTGIWRIVYIYGPTTRKQEIEQEGEIVDDQLGIDGTDIQTLTAATSTPPATPAARISGQVLVRIKSQKIQNTPQKWRHEFTFGWLTNQERIEFEDTTAETNPIDVYKRETASVLPWTDTAANLASAVAALNTADPTYERTTVRRINERKALVKVANTGADLILDVNDGREVMYPFRGRPAVGFGNPSALIHVNVQGIIVGGFGGFLGGRVMSTYRSRRTGSFLLTRRFSLSNPATKRFSALEGFVCDQAFLGFPAYTVKFIRALGQFNYSYSTARATEFRYLFQTDSEMFINEGDLPDSGSRVSTGGFPLLAGSGFYPATIFDPYFVISWPSAGDFSVFLT